MEGHSPGRLTSIFSQTRLLGMALLWYHLSSECSIILVNLVMIHSRLRSLLQCISLSVQILNVVLLGTSSFMHIITVITDMVNNSSDFAFFVFDVKNVIQLMQFFLFVLSHTAHSQPIYIVRSFIWNSKGKSHILLLLHLSI